MQPPASRRGRNVTRMPDRLPVMKLATAALAACLTVLAAGCASSTGSGQPGRPNLSAPPTPRLASISLWGLKHGRSDLAVLLVGNNCQRITEISDTAQGHNDLLGVTIAGHPDCAVYPRTRRVTVHLRYGGIGCFAWAVDATTNKALRPVPGRPRIEFSCPVMTGAPGRTR